MISVKNLNYIYQEGSPFEKQALTDVSFEIKKGEFVGIIGHTGSGKSTLIQHLNGLLKPSSGTVVIDGEDVFGQKLGALHARNKVGLVFQYPEHQLFEETVFKDIAFGPKNQGLSPGEIKERVYEAISVVGISDDLLEKSPFEISGGQKRRVAIAGVLAMKPKVLILDEPTAGLDPYGRDEILRRIKSIQEDSDLTVILVSHSMDDIAKLTDRIIVMNKSKIYADGNVKEVFSRGDELEKIGLSIPKISIIVKKLIQRGVDIDPYIYTIKDAKTSIISLLNGGNINSNDINTLSNDATCSKESTAYSGVKEADTLD